MIRNWLGSLSATWSSAGGVIVAAVARSFAYGKSRPLARWRTWPDAVSQSDALTLQVFAAAATSIARAAAPTRREGSHSVGVARLPPANWFSNRVLSNGACSTVTVLQST